MGVRSVKYAWAAVGVLLGSVVANHGGQANAQQMGEAQQLASASSSFTLPDGDIKAWMELHQDNVLEVLRGQFGQRLGAAHFDEKGNLVAHITKASDQDQNLLVAVAQTLDVPVDKFRLQLSPVTDEQGRSTVTSVVELMHTLHLKDFTVGWMPADSRVSVTVLSDDLETARNGIAEQKYPAPVTLEPAPAPELQSCNFVNGCDQPLRGGLAFGCTGGFVVQSKVNASKYVLTAGHCVTVPSAGSYKMAQDSSPSGSNVMVTLGIGYKENLGQGGDAGLIRVDAGASWFPNKPWILSYVGIADAGGAPAPTASDAYVISAVAHSSSELSVGNTRVCFTGAGQHRSRCGEVTSTFKTANYGGVDVVGLFESTACSVQGDSGGPVFSYGKAYGIISGGSGSGSGCRSLIYPTYFAQNEMGVNILTS